MRKWDHGTSAETKKNVKPKIIATFAHCNSLTTADATRRQHHRHQTVATHIAIAASSAHCQKNRWHSITRLTFTLRLSVEKDYHLHTAQYRLTLLGGKFHLDQRDIYEHSANISSTTHHDEAHRRIARDDTAAGHRRETRKNQDRRPQMVLPALAF